MVNTKPRRADARYWLGRMLNETEKYREAIWHLRFAHELDSESVETLNQLGYAYKMRGKYRKATDIFKQAISLDPKNTYAAQELDAYQQWLQQESQTKN